MYNPELTSQQEPEPENGPTPEKMVSAKKISTVFPDSSLLEKIADKLRSEGIISGFSIEPIRAGYTYSGKKVTEDQFVLNILSENSVDDSIKQRIIDELRSAIGEKWDVPAIREEQVEINESLLTFIKRSNIEHKKYLRQKNRTLSLALATLIGISGLIYEVSAKYIDKKEQQATTAERQHSYDKLTALQESIQSQIINLENKINNNEKLHAVPNDMSADDGYEETENILQSVRDAQNEMKVLKETGK